MIIDSQAFQHLELLELNSDNSIDQNGSLFSWLDHTATKFGKRRLKRWLCAPLLNVEKINERLDAVEDLRRNSCLIDSW